MAQVLKRKLNQRERVHSKSVASNISMIATINGKVSPEVLRKVIHKMQKRHPILNAYLESKGKELFLLSNEILEIPLKVIKRKEDMQWHEVIIQEHKIPFNMKQGPLIRFILLHSPDISDLIIFCQHIICDGMSLAYLARDIMRHLANPSKQVELLPIPPIINENAIPDDIKPSLSTRLFSKIINKKWEKTEVLFDYDDFYELHKAFWKKYSYKAHLYMLSKNDTDSLILACRDHGVTVNSTLIASFAIAQNQLNTNSPKYLRKYASAVDLRNILKNPIDEQFGFFAGGLEIKYKYSKNDTLWDAAKKIHKQAILEKAREKALVKTLNNFYISPTFMDAQIFGGFGELVPPNSKSYEKINDFISDDKNIVNKMVEKRLKEKFGLAQIMTNLGKSGFPEQYGDLILKNLILMPSCSPYTELVLGVITHGGTLSITLNHMEESISSEKILKIQEKANEIIMNAIKN